MGIPAPLFPSPSAEFQEISSHLSLSLFWRSQQQQQQPRILSFLVVVSPPSVWWCKLRWNRHTALAFWAEIGGEERSRGASCFFLRRPPSSRLSPLRGGAAAFLGLPIGARKGGRHHLKEDEIEPNEGTERHHLHLTHCLPQCSARVFAAAAASGARQEFAPVAQLLGARLPFHTAVTGGKIGRFASRNCSVLFSIIWL